MKGHIATEAVRKAWLGVTEFPKVELSRRMTLFYKMMNNLLSEYTMDPVLQLQQLHYFLHNQDVIGRKRARTEKIKSSFYSHRIVSTEFQ